MQHWPNIKFSVLLFRRMAEDSWDHELEALLPLAAAGLQDADPWGADLGSALAGPSRSRSRSRSHQARSERCSQVSPASPQGMSDSSAVPARLAQPFWEKEQKLQQQQPNCPPSISHWVTPLWNAGIPFRAMLTQTRKFTIQSFGAGFLTSYFGLQAV